MKNIIMLILTTLFIVGCSSTAIISKYDALPPVYEDLNDSYQVKNDVKIALFKLNNYTDTPRAGQRATNIVEGVLLSKGYNVNTYITNNVVSVESAQQKASEDGYPYFLTGAISEWRYKTGIDGEPAVSLKLNLYQTKDSKLIWSATGADSDWGTGSIGATAQNLIDKMTTN